MGTSLIPAARGEDIHDGRLAEDSGARSELSRHGEPPPAKHRVGPRGKVELMDGNHRIGWWLEQGYGFIPAWVIDERPDPELRQRASRAQAARRLVEEVSPSLRVRPIGSGIAPR